MEPEDRVALFSFADRTTVEAGYGFPLDTSPNLDAFAARGVLFERAVAAGNTTAPSHASIMTSQFVREHSIGHMNGGTRLDDVETLASVLRDAG